MPLTKELPNAVKEYFAMPQSDWIDSKSLGIATAESFTVPANARFVLFSSTDDFYALFGTTPTAAVPADVTDGSASELNPTMRYINGAKQISIISPAACVVTASYFL